MVADQFRSGASLFPLENNLEWLRLAFAIQVVLSHISIHLDSTISLPAYIYSFPGVPAFFFVSGFLIYASYKNSGNKYFFQNRFLRLMPGLIFVTVGGGAILVYAKGLQSLDDHLSTYLVWFLSQVTIGQAYNPEYFRDVGIGVINGSLWTISVEIIFYFIVPIIVYLESRIRFAVIMLGLISFLIYLAGPKYLGYAIYKNKTVNDILTLTPIIWGWMFCVGILAVKYFWYFQKWIKYFPLVVAPLLVMLISIGSGPLFESSGNRLGLIYFIAYSALILWLAFSTPYFNLAFDVSYGLYIWHMPIINLLLLLSINNAIVGLALISLMAGISWFLIENPALKLKKKSMHPI